MDDRPAAFPTRARRPRHRRCAVPAPSSRWPTCRPGRLRRVTVGDLDVLARPHAGRHRRRRRPLPAHVGAAVDRRRSTGCVVDCPLHDGRFDLCSGEPGPDADDRRPRSRRRLPPDLVAGRARAEGGPAGQEGRGAPADPGPAASATTRSGSSTAGSRSRCRLTAAAQPGGSSGCPGGSPGRTARMTRHDLVRVVGDRAAGARSASRHASRRRRASRASSRAGPAQYSRPDEDDREVADLAGLDEGQRLEQLVERAEAAGQDHERVGVLHEHRLAGEEVAELDAEVDVRVEPTARGAARCCSRSTGRRASLAAAVGRLHRRPGPPPVMTAKPALGEAAGRSSRASS